MNIVCLYITVFVIFWSLLQTVIFDRDLIEDGFESQKKNNNSEVLFYKNWREIASLNVANFEKRKSVNTNIVNVCKLVSNWNYKYRLLLLYEICSISQDRNIQIFANYDT